MTDTPKTTLTDGSPVTPDHAEIIQSGQQRDYVVLSSEERAKGFVRPVRRAYLHVGCPAPANLRKLTPEEIERYVGFGYIAFEDYGPDREPVTGCYWTAADMHRIGKGCNGMTRMGLEIAETYARDPKFYGATFCIHCRAHFPVGADGEFVWSEDGERVGT